MPERLLVIDKTTTRGASAATTAPAENRRLVSPAKAAEYAGVSHWTIRRRLSDGTLTAYRMGPRLIRVDLNQIDAWVKVIPTVGTIGTGGDAA